MAKIDLRDNEYMERFVGQDHIDSNDVQFWYQLLSCSFNFMRVQDPKIVDKTLEPYLVRLTLNNPTSLNIGSLVRVFLDRFSRVKTVGQSTNPYYVYQTFNALYLIKSICKSYIETLSEEHLIKSLKAQVDNTPPIYQTISSQLPSLPPQILPNGKFDNGQASNHNDCQDSRSIVRAAPDLDSHPFSSGPPIPVSPDIADVNTPRPTVEPIDVATSIATTNLPAPSDKSININQSKTFVQEQVKKNEYTSGTSMLDQLVSALIAIIVDIPITDSAYLLQVESINTMLVLLSNQMYSTTPANQTHIYKCLMQKKCSIHALILTKTLLNNFVIQRPMPQEPGSIIIGLASGLWKVLTLGYGSPVDTDDSEDMPLLARQSLLLLNILTNHYTNEKNPYREALVSCQDSNYNLSDPQTAAANANNDVLATASTSKSLLMSNSIKIDFHKLYETICKYLHDDQVALILYLLLHSNKIFRPYIMTTASNELDKLVLPLLKILHNSIDNGLHHVYMILIIFIILSEESLFNEVIHKIIIRGVPWYKDRALNEISLGSLLALIIIRSFQYNTFRIKDKFLHTNLFATLANLSNHFNNLHPYVCQRIVDFLERLAKKYSMTFKSQKASITQKTLDVLNSDNPLARALATDTHKQNLHDASSIELDNHPQEESSHLNQQHHYKPSEQTNGTHSSAIDMNPAIENQDENFVLPTIASPTDATSLQILGSTQSELLAGSELMSSNNESSKSHTNISMDNDPKQDLELIEEVIRMLIEVINNCLATQLSSNTDLIYTLLYKRQVFSGLMATHQSFYSMFINVERILTFFYNKIETFERQLSAEEIKDLIRQSSREWNFDQGRDPSSRLLFSYVENEKPEEFFIPYIWTRIYYSSGINWSSKRIVLFNPDDL